MGTRFAWMDQARGVAMILVIVHHSMTWLDDFELDVPLALLVFDGIVSPFRMPLLVFLSGMLVPRSMAKPTRIYFAGKVRGIVWPYLVWSVLFLAVTGTLTLSLVPNILLFPPTYLWYLWFLFAYYVLAWLLARLRVPPLPVAVVALGASVFAPEDYRIARFLFLLAFFMLGWWWTTSPLRERGSPQARMLVAATGLAAAAVVAGVTVAGTNTRYEPAYAWGVAALIAAVAIALPAVRPTKHSRPLEFIGRNSIVYYVTHFTIIWMLDVALVAVAGVRAPWVVWGAAIMTAVLVGTASCWARERFRAVALLFSLPAPKEAEARTATAR